MIYLLRHGLDDENYVGGHSENNLIEEGIKQVEEITTHIENKNLDIKRMYSSDIKRAVTTASIINKKLKVPIYYTPHLRELDKGDLTGVLVEKAKLEYPDYFKDVNTNTRYPNGESMKDLYQRIKELLPTLKNINNSLIVTHRGVINMIYYLLNNIELDMEKTRFDVTHASLHELDLENKTIKKIR